MKCHPLFFVFCFCFSALFFAASSLNALTIPASEDSYTAPRNTLSYSTNNANSLIVDVFWFSVNWKKRAGGLRSGRVGFVV
jgi:hypothetical protein